MKFSIILAVDEKNGLGKNNDLAWKLKTDMQYFKKTTVLTQDSEKINAVVMGRKTWESIPQKFRPLPGRLNFVLTRDNNYQDEGCVSGTSLDEILDIINLNPSVENIFIIGGSQIYNQVLSDQRLEKIYLTQVQGDYDCDVFFNGVPESFQLQEQTKIYEENNIKFLFNIFKRNEK